MFLLNQDCEDVEFGETWKGDVDPGMLLSADAQLKFGCPEIPCEMNVLL